MDPIDDLINKARTYVISQDTALDTAVRFHADLDDFDERLDRAVINHLFPHTNEVTKSLIVGYVTLARAVRLGANTQLDTLTPEQRQHHDRVLTRCEASFVDARAALEEHRHLLTPLQQQIVERLVEVKFNR